MLIDAFRTLYWRNFNTIQAGAAYFHVRPVTVKRWLDGTTPPNPMAEKLLLIKARGYLPNDLNWDGFQVNEDRAVLITPDGREFHPYELVTFPIWKAEYYALREKFGRISSPPIRPAREPLTVYRGPKRTAPAPWVPTRDKMK